MSARPHLLLIDGSLRGRAGNTAAVLAEVVRRAADLATCETWHLAEGLPAVAEVAEGLRRADALLVGSGVYWTSWGSPLQRFLEVVTPLEGTAAFLGKPAGVVLTMDSVGGSEVAARLCGLLGDLGCLIPPFATVVLSRVAGEAVAASAGRPDDPNDDVWRLDDVEVVLDNLLVGVAARALPWRRWPVRGLTSPEGAWPAAGPLDLGSPRFVAG